MSGSNRVSNNTPYVLAVGRFNIAPGETLPERGLGSEVDGIISKLLAVGKLVYTGAKEVAAEVAEKVEDIADSAEDTIKTVVTEAVDSVEVVTDAVVDAVETTVDAVVDAAEAAVAVVEEQADTVTEDAAPESAPAKRTRRGK